MNDFTLATPTAPLTPAPTVIPQVEAHTKASVSNAEAAIIQGWIKDDLAKGKITPEQAAEAFDDMNTPLEQRLPDSRSDEEKMLDKQFPAAKAEDFTIRYNAIGDDTPMTSETKQFDTTARTWLSEAQFPRELGNSLINTVSKVIERTLKMTPDQLIMYGETEYVKLQNAFGPALDQKLQDAAP